MNNKFKQKGIGSRAWYLSMIKTNPEQTGVNYLTKFRGISWYDARDSMNTLVEEGYIQSVGTKGRLRHQVTSFGHRYLEEHKFELDGEVGTPYTPPEEKPPLSSLRKQPQPVEEAPAFKSPLGELKKVIPKPEPPKQAIAPSTADSQAFAKRIDTLSKVEKPVQVVVPPTPKFSEKPQRPVFEVSPEGVSKETMPSEQAVKQVGEAIERVVIEDGFERRFRDILADILIERFADQVTAKDILERMETRR